jgi:hypothetical protein
VVILAVMRLAACLVVISLAAACGHKTTSSKYDEPSTCLAVPPALRYHLQASPDGVSLYWLEATRQYDYNNIFRSFDNLVRYDLRERRAEVLIDHVERPLVLRGGDVYTRRKRGEVHELVRVNRRKEVQILTPDYLDVLDVSEVDEKTLVFLADGDGNRAVYRFELDRPRYHYLGDATELYGVDGDRVYVAAKDGATVINLKTAVATPLGDVKRDVAHGKYLYTVVDETVHVLDLANGTDKVAIDKKAKWRVYDQYDSVLARTAPVDERSMGYALVDGVAKPLPNVIGGTSLFGTSKVGNKLWALVGHNTANSLGDTADTVAESDVCVLPESGPAVFKTRIVPGRYLPKQTQLMNALALHVPGAGVQISEDFDYPVTVSITMHTEMAGTDWKRMRERVKEIHEEATALVEDKNIRTDVEFADHRIAFRAWRPDRLRERTFVGMGTALMSDRAEYDVEVQGLVNKWGDKGLDCIGTLINLTANRYENVTVRCSAERSRSIKIPVLEPHASVPFNKTFLYDDDQSGPFFEVYDDKYDPLETYFTEHEARMKVMVDVALAEYAASGMQLLSHTTDKKIDVRLLAPETFATRTEVAKTAIARAAYKRYEAIRTLFDVTPYATYMMEIDIRGSSDIYDFDGTTLTKR